jgi:hypothetical protein
MSLGATTSFLKMPGELVHEILLTHIPLRALSPMAGAVVVDVPALLDLRHHVTATVAALDQATEGEVAPDGVSITLAVLVEHTLDLFKHFHGNQGLVVALVGLTIVVKVPAVNAFAKNLMQSALMNARSSKSKTSTSECAQLVSVRFTRRGKTVARVATRSETPARIMAVVLVGSEVTSPPY